MTAKPIIGIRREDKNPWERRVPIIPEHAAGLVKAGVAVRVQRSDLRAIPAEEYRLAGAELVDDLSGCGAVFAVKEIPPALLEKGRTYVFFSHTIKGQAHNMPMLRRLMQLGCQLIDYEKLTDEKGRRLVFFGKYAGLAGMIDTLWALGQRLDWERVPNPFSGIKRAADYTGLPEAEKALARAGKKLASDGLPESAAPLTVGVTGYGHVSQGAQLILKHFPAEAIKPEDLASLPKGAGRKKLYKVVFREEDMFERFSGGGFDLQEYFAHPEKYRSKFERYIPHLSVIVNCIYWDAKYPRLVTKDLLNELYSAKTAPRLKVIGDITCDTGGSVECNVRTTDIGNPVYVYDPLTGKTEDGWRGNGPVVLAVDNLPAELPKESSREFSEALLPFVEEIARADMSANFGNCGLSDTVKRATILYQGELTPSYQYLEKFLTRKAE